MKKISMIGCGNVGFETAEVMSEFYDVIGYDIKQLHNEKYKITNSLKDAVTDSDIIFIALPTPHDNQYSGETPNSHLLGYDFDYSILENVLIELNQYITDQLVVLVSTVLPGTIRNNLKKLLSTNRFLYNPSFVARGTVLKDVKNPEIVIIGSSKGNIDSDVQELLDFYKPIINNNPSFEIVTWEEAESIKIFYNAFIGMKLSLVNTIQDVAENMDYINVDSVTNALKKCTTTVAGPAYLTAGMGAAGPCHPRDIVAVRFLTEKLNLGYDLFGSVAHAREVQAKNMAKKCLEHGSKICIVGKAYKPGIEQTVGSSSLLVGNYINSLGGEVNYYDPNTGDNVFPESDVYLIGYWDTWTDDIVWPGGSTIIDPWRKFDKTKTNHKIINYGNQKNQ